MTDASREIAGPDRQRISAVLCVYNEGHQIARCLDALAWCDEVVVVDRFSTDGTPDIARTYANARLFQREDWTNPNMNFGIEQATGAWILRIDCDEIVSPEMAREIETEVLARPDVPFDGFWAPNRVYFFGKWIKYGVAYDARFKRPGYGYRQVLFRKGTALYACKSFHEELTTQGEYGRLQHHFDHYSHPAVTRWIEKMNHYTDSDVEQRDVLAPDYRLPTVGKTLAALVKIFFTYYIVRQGYRDGIHGFITCGLNTMYVFVERCKIWEKHYRLTHAHETVNY
jgi:glycosyltransferase involved in cell wall biosynthesis